MTYQPKQQAWLVTKDEKQVRRVYGPTEIEHGPGELDLLFPNTAPHGVKFFPSRKKKS